MQYSLFLILKYHSSWNWERDTISCTINFIEYTGILQFTYNEQQEQCMLFSDNCVHSRTRVLQRKKLLMIYLHRQYSLQCQIIYTSVVTPKKNQATDSLSDVEDLEGIDHRLQPIFHLLPSPLVGSCCHSVELSCRVINPTS